jgi:mono/diheme cytochrome c family protein
VRPGDLSDSKRWEDTDGALFWKLTEGRTPMPAWGETLTEEQRWIIINYVRTLSPKPNNNIIITKSGSN